MGPILAQRLGWAFVDTDRMIEEATGMAVTDIFSTFGEPMFREHETNMIAHVANMFRELVVSLGGGAIVNGKNRSLLHETGIVVYLKAAPRSLAQRLENSAELRPLLHAPDDDVAARLSRLLDEREALYEEADVTIDSEGLNAETIAARILDHLE